MRLDDRTRLLHMIEACEQVGKFVAGKGAEDLEADVMLLFALVRALEVLGEAANGLTAATRSRAADVPWHQIVSTRNRLIHGYFDVDTEIVWRTATDEVPALLPHLRSLLEDLA